MQEYEARNYAKTTSDNQPVCCNINLTSCKKAPPGQKCDRGWHVCAAPSCQDKRHPHSASSQ